MFNNKTVIYTIIGTFFVFGTLVAYYFIYKTFIVSKESDTSTPSYCLKTGEYITYPLDVRYSEKIKHPLEPLTIEYRSKNGDIINTFSIKNTSLTYHPLEVFNCGVYVITKDFQKRSINFFDFKGNNTEILSLGGHNNTDTFYTSDFRVDPLERYITLERGYLGQADYALVIKNLASTEDIFEVSLAEIVALHPQLESSLGMYGWSADGRYFWGNIFDGAEVLALLRIDVETKTWDVLTSPVGMLGGDAFNVNTAWTTYDNGLPWTGDPYLDEINRDERLAGGEVLQFYLYNVITKESRLLETIDDVSWSFKPEWVSDTELRYQVPGNLDKRYTLPTR